MQTANSMQESLGSAAPGSGRNRNGARSEPPTSTSKLIYHRLRDLIVDQPMLFYALWRGREREILEKRVTRPDSPIVIEGFPRCGNTFAYYAFLLAQEKPVPVGNHMHCVSQFALAHRWNVPAILVVRTPKDTIISNYIYESELPLTYHLRRYVNFHEAVARFAKSVVVSDFPQTTSSFGKVIMKVNDRFGTNFVPMQDTPEAQQRVLDEIERMYTWRKDLQPELMQSNRVSFPSDDKNRRKSMVQELLDQRKYSEMLKRAEEAYRALI